MDADEVAELLSSSRAKPEQLLRAIEEARRARKLALPPWEREEVILLLDEIASKSGALSISARFAKARFLLRR